MRNRVRDIKRRAFTLVELVMVIVVLGIVSMIATDIIANMYKGYIQTKIINDLEQKTETVIDQIAKRLQYRIKPTMIARNIGTDAFLAMNSPDINDSGATMVEWIGYDYDSFLGTHSGVAGTFSVPGWSGFIDVSNVGTTSAQVFTSGSDLANAQITMSALSNGTAGFGVRADGVDEDRPALIFKCGGDDNMSRYGWDGGILADHNQTLAVSRTGNNILTFDTAGIDRSICEQYYLAWTAYGLVPEGSDEDDFNLTLRYNYQPWHGEDYNTSASSSLLAEHVSTFRVMQIGETLRIKICIQDGNITGTPIGFCKEKAIF